MPTPTTTLILTLGRRRYPVASLADASAMFCAARDKAGTGSRATGTPVLHDGAGKLIGYISYNGRVWAGEPNRWTPVTPLLFDNGSGLRS